MNCMLFSANADKHRLGLQGDYVQGASGLCLSVLATPFYYIYLQYEQGGMRIFRLCEGICMISSEQSAPGFYYNVS